MAVEELNGEVKFSTQLPYPNNLSRLTPHLYSLLYSALAALSSFKCMLLCLKTVFGAQ